MKKIVLIILFIFFSLPCLAKEVIYLDKKWDKEASKILYDYAVKLYNNTPEKAYQNFGYRLSDVRAVFYDLNSDGIDEIIGYINVPSEYCSSGMKLYILKQNNKYNDISSLHSFPDEGIYILNSKTNNYYDLKTCVTKEHKFVTSKYNKQYYEYFFSN